MWPGIDAFYGISKDVSSGLFLTRTKDGKKRNIYFTNKCIKDIVAQNQDHIKVSQEKKNKQRERISMGKEDAKITLWQIGKVNTNIKEEQSWKVR